MRECGECSACCFIGEVSGLKGAHSLCPHLVDGEHRCGIYGSAERPTVCHAFQCAWLRGAGGEEDRPDKSGLMLSVNHLNGGTWSFAIETEPGALYGSGREVALDLIKRFDRPMIVVSHGSLPPDDKGDLIVVKRSLHPRAQKNIGEQVGRLSLSVGVYKLRRAA